MNPNGETVFPLIKRTLEGSLESLSETAQAKVKELLILADPSSMVGQKTESIVIILEGLDGAGGSFSKEIYVFIT